MTNISPVDSIKIPANYNAVNIRVDEPKIKVNGSLSENENSGIYNAVNVRVTNPTIDVTKNSVYDYPEAKEVVTYDMAGVQPVDVPQIPAPNYTTVEDEKSSALSFKAAEKKTPEIIPAVEIKPDVDINNVVNKLSDKNYDVQALQMAEIAKAGLEDPQKGVPYVAKEVFTALIDIVKKDVSNLTPPTEAQNEARKKIIINELALQQAVETKQDMKTFEAPYKLSEEEVKLAVSLSEMELAERNKEYAITTMAILSKIYTDEAFRHTGSVVPLTDLPGVSETVDVLKNNDNSGLKLTAIDALVYINRPEYKGELASVLTLASKDENPYVARNAQRALEIVNK